MLRSLGLDRKRLKIIRLTQVRGRLLSRAADCQFRPLGVRHAAAGRKLGTRMRGTLVRSLQPAGGYGVCGCLCARARGLQPAKHFSAATCCPEGALEQIPLGASQEQVLLVLGTPSTVATVSGEAFYYISQKADRPVAFMQTKITDQRVIAVYFDRNRKVQRLAEYGIKDGHAVRFRQRHDADGRQRSQRDHDDPPQPARQGFIAGLAPPIAWTPNSIKLNRIRVVSQFEYLFGHVTIGNTHDAR